MTRSDDNWIRYQMFTAIMEVAKYKTFVDIKERREKKYLLKGEDKNHQQKIKAVMWTQYLLTEIVNWNMYFIKAVI